MNYDMEHPLAVSQQPPFPQPPQPLQPQPRQPQPPMIYVYEAQKWEYKIVVRKTADEKLLSEDELNALGGEGWELVGAATVADHVQFYFKRGRK